MKIWLVLALIILSFVGCYKTEITEVDVLDPSAWSPYAGVHTFSLGAQRSDLEPLIKSGNLRGVRLGWVRDNPEMIYWFNAQGIEILGIFENEFLRDPNVVEIFHDQVRQYPFIKHWEIGNEVDYFIGMSAQEYMTIFDKIYQASRDWGITILSQAPFGNIDGAGFFKEMVDNGLNKYPDIIVALHLYAYDSDTMHRFSGQVSRLSYIVPIWVTETGIKDQSKHIGYVNEIYPDIRNVLRADRIYWYVFSECSEHSLVMNLCPTCSAPKIISPLYSQLTGFSVQGNSESKIFKTRR